MSGEDEAWCRLAESLGMSLDEVQEKHTYSQFIAWLEYRARKIHYIEPIYYYLAQITHWIVWASSKTGAKIPSVNDLLIRFVNNRDDGSDDVSKSAEQLEQERKTRLAASKAFWKGLVAVGRRRRK